jgi:hypothetical protein
MESWSFARATKVIAADRLSCFALRTKIIATNTTMISLVNGFQTIFIFAFSFTWVGRVNNISPKKHEIMFQRAFYCFLRLAKIKAFPLHVF